jgi:hypothetical protein
MDAADHQNPEEATLLRDLVSETWVRDPEAFEHHFRVVDANSPDWVIEEHPVPGRPMNK